MLLEFYIENTIDVKKILYNKHNLTLADVDVV
jgi:hypothetical protein